MLIRRREPLAPHTTFGIGGRAREYQLVTTVPGLLRAVNRARAADQPYQVIAGGSNVIFGDGEYAGLVIQFMSTSPRLVVTGERELTVVAGTALGAVVRAAVRRGWAGLETLAGIPGTIGGAVVGNAGAYGHSVSEVVSGVEIFDPATAEAPAGGRRWLSPEDCRFGYRDSVFKQRDWLVLQVKLRFRPGESRTLREKARGIIKTREKKYRPGLACPGSFFKNLLVTTISRRTLALAKIDSTKIVEGKIPAGYLLEQVGARGLKTKHLAIADFHGNLIINRGGATCVEVKRLAAELKRRVRERFGLRLEEEVRYLS